MADEKKGNGQQGMDLIVMLHAEVLELSRAFDRQHQENVRHHEEQKRHYEEQKRQYEELKSHVRRMAEILVGVGDRLNDHDRRLSAIESKFR